MHDKWREWAQGSGWASDREGFWVQLGGRRQRVVVADERDGAIFRSRVARRAIVNRTSEPELRAWQRNRVSELVGFRVDRQGVMVAETAIPDDITRDEWMFLALNLARCADRFEYLLSGQDEE